MPTLIWIVLNIPGNSKNGADNMNAIVPKFNDIVDGVRHLRKILFIYLQDFSPVPENWHAMSMKF